MSVNSFSSQTAEFVEQIRPVPKVLDQTSMYERMIQKAQELITRPKTSVEQSKVHRQHGKNRMTIWERIDCLTSKPPQILFNNWGENLDGASIVTAIVEIDGRQVALYGHDFMVKSGSIDYSNADKIIHLLELAARCKLPVVGLNESSGAYVPDGISGLDGYAKIFRALRKLSGVVPSIMCMFGYNAGGGAYLPRQGSFVIQPKDSFFGLTGADVVSKVLGQHVTPNELGGPNVHKETGVADFVVEDEVAALKKVRQLLSYLPSNNHEMPPRCESLDPVTRRTDITHALLGNKFESPTGINTPIDVHQIILDMCDHGDFIEIQPDRAKNTTIGLGRMAGFSVGFVANNSAHDGGQIDIHAAHKNTRFIRFCNLYNIPVIFLEDTTGYLPGKEQETAGIVQYGRAMLDAIIDLRTPRFLLILRNAFGGSYASFNNYATGAHYVAALPSARVAVMGTAGVRFVYKEELKELDNRLAHLRTQLLNELPSPPPPGSSEEARIERQITTAREQEEQRLQQRYESEIMNMDMALAMGSVSNLIQPWEIRRNLTQQLHLHLSNYTPIPLDDIQREFQ